MDLLGWLETLFVSFVILVIFWALGKSIEYTLENWVSTLTKKTATGLDDRIVDKAKKPLHYLLLFIGFYIALTRLPLEGSISRIIDGIIYIMGVTVCAFLVYRIINEILKWYSEKISAATVSGLDREFIPLIEKVAAVFIFLGALIAILKHFNQDIYSLVTALGVGSLAIGLAAKDTLANMISGFTIMVDRPFRPGDRIELDSGTVGDVVKIGMRSTKIKTFFNTILIVPNNDLVTTRLINHSYPDSKVNGRIEVGVAYGTDVEKAKQAMLQAALSVEEVLREPEPSVFFTKFGDFSLNLLLIYWVADYSIRFATQDKVNVAIDRVFAEAGIEIPFPIRTIISKEEDKEEKPDAKPKAAGKGAGTASRKAAKGAGHNL